VVPVVPVAELPAELAPFAKCFAFLAAFFTPSLAIFFATAPSPTAEAIIGEIANNDATTRANFFMF
jgi:hypothetical protein